MMADRNGRIPFRASRCHPILVSAQLTKKSWFSSSDLIATLNQSLLCVFPRVIHPLHNSSGGKGAPQFVKKRYRKNGGVGAYIVVPVRNARDFSLQRFSVMNKRFF